MAFALEPPTCKGGRGERPHMPRIQVPYIPGDIDREPRAEGCVLRTKRVSPGFVC